MSVGDIAKLALAIIICHLAGFFGAFFTAPSIPVWYAALEKPFFTPPSWLFAPVWLSLYTLMGISAYLVWLQGLGKPEVRKALSVFGVQLVLNALWSFLFFGLQSPMLGLAEIVVLWVLILLTIKLFYKISRNAALLLVPYILWVTVATALNFSIWMLNM